MILSGMKDEGFEKFFEKHEIGNKMTDLNLIFIGNGLTSKSMTHLEKYLEGTNLENFALNLYANSLGFEGGEILGKSLKNLNGKNQVKSLAIDLYFSNVTEIGTKAITDSIVEMNNLESLSLNFDFNYIKN